MNYIVPVLLLAAAVAGCGQEPSANAATASSEPSALALEVAGLRVPPVDLKSQIAASLKRQVAEQIGSSGEHSAAITAAMSAIDAEVDRQFATLLEPAAVRAAAEVYDRSYTQAELGELRGFYSTSVGQLLFGKASSDDPASAEAAEAANSPAGTEFLQSSVGRRENEGVSLAAENAAAEAVRSGMPTVIDAVRRRVVEALQTTTPGANGYE